jgi:hypothetical protein
MCTAMYIGMFHDDALHMYANDYIHWDTKIYLVM